MPTRIPVAIDIFAGAGGLSEGFLSAGINVALAIEHHLHPALTNAFNHCDCTVMCADIKKIKTSQIKTEVKRRTGSSNIDIVAGGPPCQGFSSAGKQDANDPRNSLIYEFVRIVSEVSPACFVFENVPTIVEANGGKFIRSMLDMFWEMGFQLYGIDNDSDYYPDVYPIVDSSWFGVPQSRKRLILVGWKKHFDNFRWLGPSLTIAPSRRPENVSVFEAIGDLDFLESGYECHAYPKPPASKYQTRRRANNNTLLNHLASLHRKETVEKFRRYLPGQTVSSIPAQFRTGKQRVRRFSMSELAPAVLALPDDFIHYTQNRIPTVRELARLQSFDDDFVFLGKRTTSDKNRRHDVPQYTQVGNAVPPLLARSLGRAIIKAFGGSPKDIRDKSSRQKRISFLTGSSAYSGYEMGNELEAKINLINLEGKRIDPELLRFNNLITNLDRNAQPIRWAGREPQVA